MVKSINGIIGIAIGDAMGVPLEFMPREKLLNNPVTKMLGNGTHDMPKGTWSDDTSMTLATIDSINETLTIDSYDLAKRFLDWMKNGKYTIDKKAFDIGTTTLQSLAVFEQGDTEPEKCGGDLESENGNGSLMRMLPLAYFAYSKKLNEEAIYDIVRRDSSITHSHEISIMACYIYVTYAIQLLKGKTKDEAYRYIKQVNYRDFFSHSTMKKFERIVKYNIFEYSLEEIKSSSYVLDTLEATLWVIHNTDNFNSAIIGAINLGDDTDTVGACTGGLAGIIYGLQTMNIDWKVELLQYNYIKELCEKFDKVLRIIENI